MCCLIAKRAVHTNIVIIKIIILEANMKEKLLLVGEAEKIVKDLIDEDNNDELYELAYRLLNQEKVYGSEDDFHNFSLNYCRKDAYDLACDILEKGIEQFPRSVDLLSDYLQVGINCNRVKQCEKYYNDLFKIPKIRWTWRGFSFSIDYMLFLANSLNEDELTAMKQQMLLLADEYHDLFPVDEDPYICKADIYDFFNDKKSVKEILTDATNTINVCPKCSLRLSNLLFDEGAYDESLVVLNKCLYQSIQTQDSVNHGYLYYLSGLCKTVLLLKKGDFQDKNAVLDIYYDFMIAQNAGLQHASYLRVIRRQIDILELHSGVNYND